MVGDVDTVLVTHDAAVHKLEHGVPPAAASAKTVMQVDRLLDALAETGRRQSYTPRQPCLTDAVGPFQHFSPQRIQFSLVRPFLGCSGTQWLSYPFRALSETWGQCRGVLGLDRYWLG